jgi:AraC-like DNA-binding protein
MVACLADSPTGSNVAGSLVRSILVGIEALGGEVDGLRASLEPGPDVRVDPAQLRLALAQAARALGEPALGLRLAQVLPVGSFGFFEYCAMASPTLRDGLRQAARFIPLLSERLTLGVHETDDEAHVVLRLRRNTQRIPHVIELALAALASRCRDAVGDALVFRRVGIAAPALGDPAAYASHFRATVVFEAPVDELVLERSQLDVPLRTADPATSVALCNHGRGLCPDLQAPDPFLDDVRDAARRGLERGDAHVRTTAAALGLSARTLQRRLGDLGVSYKTLVDDVRREMALQLVGRRTTAELAQMLGFTTAAAFFRAFRRWTGTTPRAHLVAVAGVP